MTHQQPASAADARLADVVPIGLGYRPAATPGAPTTTITEDQGNRDELVPADRAEEPVLHGTIVAPDRAPSSELVAAARTLYGRVADVARRPDRIAWAVIRHELYHGTLGSARGIAALWAWATARELDTHLATNPKLVLDTRRVRQRIALGAVGGAVAGATATWIMVGPAAVIAAVALILAVAGAVERSRRPTADTDGGRAALGTHPGARAIRQAVAHARLGKPDQIRVIGPVTRTGNAWEATVELPPGTTYKHAIRRRSELAGAIGVDEVQVALDPVRGHHGRVRLWVADDDPMQGERVVNPLVTRTQPFNLWRDKIFAGRDPRGRVVEFSLVERSYLIGGEPGGGKSVTSNNILAAVSLDPTVRLFLADGKFGFDLAAYEDMAEHVVTEPGHGPMMDMLEQVRDEMARRYALLRKIGSTKVTEELAKKHCMHPIVLHIDEIQTWSASGDTKADKAFVVALADIVGRGRAAGIITGAVTQRPAAEVVPTRLRDLLSIRIALRCTTPDASDTILGSGRAAQGYSAAMFNADQRGAGYLLAEGAQPVQMRSAYMTETETERVTRRAYELRKAAGTLPATADRPEIRLLTAILDAMDHPKGIHTADLLERLAAASDEYAGWDSSRLAAAVKPLGLLPGQLDIDGRNRNGYRRDRVQAALDRA